MIVFCIFTTIYKDVSGARATPAKRRNPTLCSVLVAKKRQQNVECQLKTRAKKKKRK